MNGDTPVDFRVLIQARLDQIDQENRLGADGQNVVTLDQQAVGRLSRMDALQSQAMAKAGQARRNAEKTRLEAALLRLEAGAFGYCDECGAEIAEKRLAFDPGVTRCIGCASG